MEVLSGESFDEYLRRQIFEPLGMQDTAFFVPPEKVDRFAACYDRQPGKKLRVQDDPQRSRYLAPPRFVSGGGGLVSTATDTLRFCRMLLGGGELDGARLIARRQVGHVGTIATAAPAVPGADRRRADRRAVGRAGSARPLELEAQSSRVPGAQGARSGRRTLNPGRRSDTGVGGSPLAPGRLAARQRAQSFG